MDNAHCNERSLNTNENSEVVQAKKSDDSRISTLKDEYENKIEKLKLENKIKVLEIENKSQLKIMQLEKDNQALKHELDVLKLKTTHDVESKKLTDDKKLIELEKKMAEKENKYKIKIKELETGNQTNLLKMEQEKDTVILKLENEIEMLKANIKEEVQEEGRPEERFWLNSDKLLWGIDSFFREKTVDWKLFSSYQEWFTEIISIISKNKKPFYVTSGDNKYLFMRKDFENIKKALQFVEKNERSTYKEMAIDFVVDIEKNDFHRNGKFVLLHPSALTKSIELREGSFKYDDYVYWFVENLPKDIFSSQHNSAIVLGFL
ncbi:putative leucine-rich repeat-containing protein DDB_G0290503 [Clytia hemisphaerica]|uniref:putative leucine-rich repeat-containing protein DDB_G0290503 n=1 Tax=Clytia hemisphaerica TaxID=252671 RepID=UPI0034D62ECE